MRLQKSPVIRCTVGNANINSLRIQFADMLEFLLEILMKSFLSVFGRQRYIVSGIKLLHITYTASFIFFVLSNVEK
jgi:hypothetical protein